MAFETNDYRAAFALASALTMLLLGVATLCVRRARARGALAFGLFVTVWSVQLILSNLLTILESQHVAIIRFVTIALHIPLPYFLMEFATALETGRGVKRWAAARWLAAAIAFTNAALLVLTPELLLGRSGSSGPLYTPFILAPYFLSFGLAMVAMARAYASAPTVRTRLRVLPVLLGLGLYAAFQTTFQLAFYGVGLFLYPIVARDIQLLAIFAPTAILVAFAIDRVRRATPADSTRLERLVPAALGIALAYGFAEGAFASAYANAFSTLGLWRLAGVAVIAYGLARWRIFDLPQKTRRAAAVMGGATLSAGTGATAFGATALVTTTFAAPIVVAVLVAGASLIPSLKFMRHLVARPSAPEVAERKLYGQRLDTYRAALESSLARDTLVEDEPFLEGLRERFGITEDEHRVILHYAEGSVVVARDGDAAGAYERLRLLGEGGSGRTWLARDRSRDRLVVLKEPLEHWQRDGNLRDAVMREARLASRVRHDNVVRVEEVLDNRGSPLIVMEFLEGGSVTDLVRSRGALPWREAAELVAQAARGLEAVHAAGILHRDVKPANILLDARGRPKLADFGIALGVAQQSGRTIIATDDGPVMGSPSYMAPEARTGRGDKRADIYGLAAVLHECVYGAPPNVNGPVIVREDVPTELTRLMSKGLAADPEARFPSARAFSEELARLVRN